MGKFGIKHKNHLTFIQIATTVRFTTRIIILLQATYSRHFSQLGWMSVDQLITLELYFK